MKGATLVRLSDAARDAGISYDWIRHRLDYFDWTRATDGHLWVDPADLKRYVAAFYELPAIARVAVLPHGEGKATP